MIQVTPSDRIATRQQGSTLGVLALLLLGGAMAPTSAWAFDDDAIDVSPLGSYRYDSNLFRLPDGVSPNTDQSRSASTRSAGIGLQIDKTYGLQHFVIGGNVMRVTYAPFASLDTTSEVINASWAWSLTPFITGNVIVNRTRAPNNFSDTGVQGTANDRVQDYRRLDVDVRSGGAVHPQLSFIRDEDKSDQTTFNRSNANTTSLQGGLIYEFRSGNTATVYFRRGRGNYLNLDTAGTPTNDARFSERETGLAAHYRSSGFSALDGQIGYLFRDNGDVAQRNFGGLVGQVTYTYTATGKTQIQVQASRSLYSAQSLDNGYTVDESISLGPVWAVTSKINVHPSYAISRRDFKGGLGSGDPLQMTVQTINFSIDWNVYRNVTLTFAALRESRSSNNPSFQYADRGAQVAASFRF